MTKDDFKSKLRLLKAQKTKPRLRTIRGLAKAVFKVCDRQDKLNFLYANLSEKPTLSPLLN